MERLASEYVPVNIGSSDEDKKKAIEANFGRRAIVTSLGQGISAGVLKKHRSRPKEAYYVSVPFSHEEELDYSSLRELLVSP